MKPQHISTVPTFPNGRNAPAVYEPHGLCVCPPDPRDWLPWGECRRCFRLKPKEAA